MRVVRPILVITVALLLAACARPEADWEEAREQDTIGAYQEFLQEHPDSEFSFAARERISELEREQAWAEAQAADSPEAYEQFEQDYPDSAEAEEASQRLTALRAEQRWQQLADTQDRAALESFVAEFPDTPEAEQARARIEELRIAEEEEAQRQERERDLAVNTHRVQLAALGTADAARTSAERLQQQLSDWLGEAQIEAIESGNLHLLQTTPMPQEEASALCTQLRDQGQDCFVVER